MIDETILQNHILGMDRRAMGGEPRPEESAAELSVAEWLGVENVRRALVIQHHQLDTAMCQRPQEVAAAYARAARSLGREAYHILKGVRWEPPFRTSFISATGMSVIGRQLADRLADQLEAAGVHDPRDPNVHEAGLPTDLPKFWALDVANVMHERRAARRDAARRRSYLAVQHAGMREHMFSRVNEEGACVATEADLRYLGTRARNNYHPDQACRARAYLRDAVVFNRRQGPHAEHWKAVFPVEVAEGADPQACRANLAAFCRAIGTRDGAFEATLYRHPAGDFVVLECRASIPD